MSPPKNVSRRGFLGIFRKDSSSQTETTEAPVSAAVPGDAQAEGVAKVQTQGFSLEAFYAARVPATELHVTLAPNLPRVATTRVGVPDLVPALGPPAASRPDSELATTSDKRRRETKP